MTERLYYTDSYVREFQARVVDRSADGLTVYLDRSAFYPASGGQPCDAGTISGVSVLEVIDEGERIAHRLATPGPSGPAACAIDWERRFDHMQQHTGQHLLSATLEGTLGLRTVGFHLGAEISTIDLEGRALGPAEWRDAERRANQLVWENRPVSVGFEEAGAAEELRKPSERTGALRVVTIQGLDRSACGGTHVRATGEIGAILLRKTEKVRQTVRLEFLCGGRALARARADYNALAQCAQLFSAPLDQTPTLLAAQLEAARAAEKARRKLAIELAGYHGREMYAATAPDADGVRRLTRPAASGSLEELRALAQSFTGQPKAVFVALLEDPPAVLLAASADTGLDAGHLLQSALAEAGGKGGGNPRIAQGSVPGRAALETVLEKLGRAAARG